MPSSWLTQAKVKIWPDNQLITEVELHLSVAQILALNFINVIIFSSNPFAENTAFY